MFYTKNGKYLGVAFKNVSVTTRAQQVNRLKQSRKKDYSALYASVCVQSTGEEITVNFVEPFMFDLQGYQMSRLHGEYSKEVSR